MQHLLYKSTFHASIRVKFQYCTLVTPKLTKAQNVKLLMDGYSVWFHQNMHSFLFPHVNNLCAFFVQKSSFFTKLVMFVY